MQNFPFVEGKKNKQLTVLQTNISISDAENAEVSGVACLSNHPRKLLKIYGAI
jgi:hypothetical protein